MALDSSADPFLPWNASEQLSAVSPIAVRYSKGFLQCKPAAWFPGLSAHWLPLFHTLGVELEGLGAKPLLLSAEDAALDSGDEALLFGARIDGMLFGIALPGSQVHQILHPQIAHAAPSTKHLVMEYLCRRLAKSLAQSWSAREKGDFLFESGKRFHRRDFVASIDCQFRLNGAPSTVQVLLSQELLDKLDQLWTNQLTQGVGTSSGSLPIKLVLGAIHGTPSEMASILMEGKHIPLTIGSERECFLFLHDEPWMKGSLLWGGIPKDGGHLVFRVRGEVDNELAVESGQSQLLFELGGIDVSRGEMMVLSQPEALVAFPESRSNSVTIKIGGQKAAEGAVTFYDDQLFIKVTRVLRGEAV